MGINPGSFTPIRQLDVEQRSSLTRLNNDRAAILVHAPTGLNPTSVYIGATALPVQVVAGVDVCPGMRGNSQTHARRPPRHVDAHRSGHRPEQRGLDERQAAGGTEPDNPARQLHRLSEVNPAIRIGNSALLPIG